MPVGNPNKILCLCSRKNYVLEKKFSSPRMYPFEYELAFTGCEYYKMHL